MPQEPKPNRRMIEIKPVELRRVLREIQELLWLDPFATDKQRSNGGSTRFWNPEKDNSLGTLTAIADVLAEHGLKPENP
jgi:hypothetical protein